MSLSSLLKKLAGIRADVHQGSKYDRLNIADEVRGQPATRMLSRIKLQWDKVIRTGNDALEFDINRQASLKVGELNFLARAKNTFGNLLTLSIIKTAEISEAVDEEQLIAFDAVPDAGLWSVSFGEDSTSDLAFNADAAAVQAALRLIEGLEDVTVAGDYTSGFTVTFEGEAGGVDQPMLVEDTNTLEASAAPVEITISEEVAGAAAVDTTEVVVSGSDIKVYCVSDASNEDVLDLIEASSQANAMISVTIDDSEEATEATAVLNAPFEGGA